MSYIPLTLPSALVVSPLSSLPPLQAKRCWLLANLGFMVLTLVLLVRSTSFGPQRTALVMFLALIPLSSNFCRANACAGAAIAHDGRLVVLQRSTPQVWFDACGCNSVEDLSRLFLIFFLLKKKWRAAAGLVIGTGAAALLSIHLFRNSCLPGLR